jgi:L-alanine-DL-glutamate epimerase-like enolase superfamily enzyme
VLPRALEARSGWVRRTTRIELQGADHAGAGEDVNWVESEQQALQQRDPAELLACCGGGRVRTFGDLVDALDRGEVLAGIERRPDARLYRRWAFESAGLDLALRQNGLSLAAALQREPRPLRFVSSAALAGPDPIGNLRRWLEQRPELRLKVDYEAGWTDASVAALAALDVVDVVDLKGLYHGDFSGPPADAEGYRRVARAFPRAWIEDPALTPDTTAALAEAADRLTWDANLHGLADLLQRPREPRAVNVKPSRFGFVRELLAFYGYCEARGIEMYGGGQFELDVGRRQIQLLASLFHPDGPNDTAPLPYHDPRPRAEVPASPLPVAAFALPIGF